MVEKRQSTRTAHIKKKTVFDYFFDELNIIISPLNIVNYCGVFKLGGLVQGSPGSVPLRLRLSSLFQFSESFIVLKIKNNWLIFIVTLYSYIFIPYNDDTKPGHIKQDWN